MQFSLWFINVGYGDAIYGEAEEDGAVTFRMLMDGGSAHRHEQVGALLAERGVRRLDLMVATHLHEDHMAGLALAAQELEQVGEFWSVCRLPDGAAPVPVEPEWPYYTGKTGESINALCRLQQEALPRLGARTRFASEGELAPGMLREFGGVSLELLHTGGERTAATARAVGRLYREPDRLREHLEEIDSIANEACLAIRLTAGQTSVLLPGDNLLGWWHSVPRERLQASVLKLSHHGAADGTSAELVALVAPRAAVVSVGLDRADRPESSILQALQHVPLYRTESRAGAPWVRVRWTDDLPIEITAG